MMKKLILILAVLLSNTVSTAYSQSSSEKAGKGQDKSHNRAKNLTKNGPAEYLNNAGGEAYKNVQIKSFSSQIDLALESCIRDGNKVTITYYLTNKGNKLDILSLGAPKSIIKSDNETSIVGNDGNNYALKYYELGDVRTNEFKLLTVPSGTRLKGTFEIADVSTAVKQLSLVNIAGLINSKQKNMDFKPFSFSFKDVPVYSLDETLAMENPTTLSIIENPGIIKTSFENSGVKTITLTDQYTRIDCFWKNAQFKPMGTIYVENMDSYWIEADGKKYALVQYTGMGSRKGDLWVQHDHTADFTYIFEPIPATVSSINIHGEGINFTGVNLKENGDTSFSTSLTSLDIKQEEPDCKINKKEQSKNK